ncbi:hypothetical protein QJQ45_013246 [Haematococcus lacustris]|nr:hypothetical protein QJQ45_013246 [Haematococcus lacustris]
MMGMQSQCGGILAPTPPSRLGIAPIPQAATACSRFIELEYQPRVKACSEWAVLASLLLGLLVRGLFTIHVADPLGLHGQPVYTGIPVSQAAIPDLSCRNLFLQLCRGLPGNGANTRPSAAVAAVLAAHPDLRARLAAIPRYHSDGNMVDHVGKQLETVFSNMLSNMLTPLFAGRVKKSVSLAGAKVLVGTDEHQRRFELPRMGKHMGAVNPLAHLDAEWLGVDPGKTNMATVPHEERSAAGTVVPARQRSRTAGQYYRDSGITRQAQATKTWLAQPKPQLNALSHATYDAMWVEVSKPRWANATIQLYCGKKRVVAGFWSKAKQRWPDRVLALAYGAAGFSGSGSVGYRGVPVSQMLKEPMTQFPAGRVLMVDEFRTSRVSSADSNPSEALPGQPPESFRFYDRDVSAALNIRHCAFGLGPRPTELCYWEGRQTMPKLGQPGPGNALVSSRRRLAVLGVAAYAMAAYASAHKELRILAFGDSLTEGYYRVPSQQQPAFHPYTKRLQSLLHQNLPAPCKVVTEGVSGELVVPTMTQRLRAYLQRTQAAGQQFHWPTLLAHTSFNMLCTAVHNIDGQAATEAAASEPGPSTPPTAKRSKRTKAEQAAESTQPTKGKGKAKGKAAKAKPPPQPIRWLDRDCSAALNMQRIGESRWRPLELCWWPEQVALPVRGKEYRGLGYKRLRDRPPKAQQQQQSDAQFPSLHVSRAGQHTLATNALPSMLQKLTAVKNTCGLFGQPLPSLLDSLPWTAHYTPTILIPLHVLIHLHTTYIFIATSLGHHHTCADGGKGRHASAASCCLINLPPMQSMSLTVADTAGAVTVDVATAFCSVATAAALAAHSLGQEAETIFNSLQQMYKAGGAFKPSQFGMAHEFMGSVCLGSASHWLHVEGPVLEATLAGPQASSHPWLMALPLSTQGGELYLFDCDKVLAPQRLGQQEAARCWSDALHLTRMPDHSGADKTLFVKQSCDASDDDAVVFYVVLA